MSVVSAAVQYYYDVHTKTGLAARSDCAAAAPCSEHGGTTITLVFGGVVVVLYLRETHLWLICSMGCRPPSLQILWIL
jgi:hypothetical protein